MKHLITLKVNGDTFSIAVDPWRTLNEVPRDDLNLTGTKFGCGTGDCGVCTVLMDGKTVNSCLTLAVEAEGKEITTVEGLAPSGEEYTLSRKRLWKRAPSNAVFARPVWSGAIGSLSSETEPRSKRNREPDRPFGKLVPLYRLQQNC